MAYNVATLFQKDMPMPDGRTRVVIRFTGNAGEPQKDRELYLDGNSTGLSIRQWCIAEADRMGSGKVIADSLTIGQSINLAPIAPAAPSAKEVWLSKAERLRYAKALGLTDAEAISDLNALETDVNATYVAGYL